MAESQLATNQESDVQLICPLNRQVDAVVIYCSDRTRDGGNIWSAAVLKHLIVIRYSESGKMKAMKEQKPTESASAAIDARIKELGDWRGKTLAKVREIIRRADPEIVEEWKWAKATSPGTPVWSHGGIICTGETYKNYVKMTFAKGATLQDPSGLFNSSLDGNVRRAIDIHEGEKIDERALEELIGAAVALNLASKGKPKPVKK